MVMLPLLEMKLLILRVNGLVILLDWLVLRAPRAIPVLKALKAALDPLVLKVCKVKLVR